MAKRGMNVRRVYSKEPLAGGAVFQVEKELHLNASLYTLLQILSVSIFEKPHISCAMQPDTTGIIALHQCNYIILLDF